MSRGVITRQGLISAGWLPEGIDSYLVIVESGKIRDLDTFSCSEVARAQQFLKTTTATYMEGFNGYCYTKDA
jgi:hypothetical protein